MNTLVGPLVSRRQLDRVERYIEIGRTEGAEPIRLTTDRRIDGLGGFFPEPTVFRGVTPDMRVHLEEIFGPVLVVMTFEEEEEAVSLANGTKYGLSSSIWTNDLRRAERMTARMDSGIVWVNTVHNLHPGSPYGGFRQSGIGSEMGTEAVGQFMKTKSVWVAADTYKSPWTVETAA